MNTELNTINLLTKGGVQLLSFVGDFIYQRILKSLTSKRFPRLSVETEQSQLWGGGAPRICPNSNLHRLRD